MGALFFVLGITQGLHSSGLVWGIASGLVIGALGSVWIMRALHARVELSEDTLSIFGYVRTRRIARAAIIGFGSNGSVEWTSEGGAQRSAMIFVLGQMRPVAGPPPPLQQHFANDDLDVIKKWAEEDHPLTQNW
ncbi:hypothetical protein [Frondihabitans peucedani]